MFFLLADTAPTNDYVNTIGNVSIVSVIIFLMLRYAPRLLEKHIQFVDATHEQGERSTKALETLAAAGGDVKSTTQRTAEALLHGTHAVESFLEDHPKKDDVMPHIDRIRDVLGK